MIPIGVQTPSELSEWDSGARTAHLLLLRLVSIAGHHVPMVGGSFLGLCLFNHFQGVIKSLLANRLGQAVEECLADTVLVFHDLKLALRFHPGW